MRDDPTFVEQIQRDLRDVRWPEPGEIRARARRRSRRAALAATVVLTLAGAATAVALGGVGRGVPSVPAAASVSPSAPVRGEIATESLVQAADLAQPVRVELSQSGFGEPIIVQAMLGYCRKSQRLTPVWSTSRWSRSQTLLRETPVAGVEAAPGDVLLSQDLYRLTPGEADSFFGGLDQLVAPCAEWRSVGAYELRGVTGTGTALHRWAVVQRGFAGDEAALLRHTVSQAVDQKTGEPLDGVGQPTSTAVVRVGDLVTVLSLGQTGTEPELRRLAAVAARRMCVAANPAC
ncbi:hypothetical protein [Micromonospora sp. 050-3]|uniref:hypothetical protein n=1 Tax=Micromonospora sp. 050-3 TaxID=2789265 RepID=UPI00397A9511